MDDMYGLQLTPADYPEKLLMWPENLMIPAEYMLSPDDGHRFPVFGSDSLLSAASASVTAEAASITPVIQRGGGDDDDVVSNAIKARIASHPSYPKLLEAYIDCRKIGAPPEIACLLDEIRRENDVSRREGTSTCLGADLELDKFMETYCDVLAKYKSNLSTPFDEATAFLSQMEIQLGNLCEDDEAAASTDEEVSGDEQERELKSEEREIKDELLRKYGSHIGRLKQKFSKKKKKGKLPKEARQLLLDWWNLHCRWPYPTESDKISLAESTGLDHKQINNWFINQRKRHWKPSESMQLALMSEISGPFFTDN